MKKLISVALFLLSFHATSFSQDIRVLDLKIVQNETISVEGVSYEKIEISSEKHIFRGYMNREKKNRSLKIYFLDPCGEKVNYLSFGDTIIYSQVCWESTYGVYTTNVAIDKKGRQIKVKLKT
jgi:hypothetical protein